MKQFIQKGIILASISACVCANVALANESEDMLMKIATKSHFSSSYKETAKHASINNGEAKTNILANAFSTKYHVAANLRPQASTQIVTQKQNINNPLLSVSTKRHF